MRRPPWLLLLLLWLAQPIGSLAASKTAEQPDKEMLRMMDFLKDWDVINNMEMMRDLHQVAPEASQPPRAGAREPPPARKKEVAK
jgi:hypothetical protein